MHLLPNSDVVRQMAQLGHIFPTTFYGGAGNRTLVESRGVAPDWDLFGRSTD